MFELKHLRAFCAIAEELHFGRAAARLCITQPPLSQLLKQLEVCVDERLFERSTRSVKLTSAGREFLLHARSILNSADQAAREAKRAAAGVSGQLSIGFVPSASYQFLPPTIRIFREKYPDVRLQFTELVFDKQFDHINRGIIDVGIVRSPIESADLHTSLVWEERFVLATPSTHRFSRLDSLNIKRLSGEPFVTYGPEDSPYFYSKISSLLSQAKVHPKIMQRGALHSILAFVAAGIGVAIVAESAQSVSISNVKFIRLTHYNTKERAPLFAVWQKSRDSELIKNWLWAARKARSSSAKSPP